MDTNMIGKFLCPGCTCGSAPAEECESYKPWNGYGFGCQSHSAGTFKPTPAGMATFCLGLPNGFNRVGYRRKNGPVVRLWAEGKDPGWDRFNVPVWAMEQDGFLFVRTMSPRVEGTWIDVIKGGTLDMCPGAVNVGEFLDEID